MTVSSVFQRGTAAAFLFGAGILVALPGIAADLPPGALGKLDGRLAISAAFSPDGKLLASGGNFNIEVWDVASGKRLRELIGHDSSVYSVAFSPDGKLLASGGADHSARIWEVATGKEVAQFKGHSQEVRSVCFSADGKLLASGSGDHTVALWNVATGKGIRAIEEDKWVYSVAFSPDGKFLAVGTMSREIRLWDTATGEPVRTFTGHKSLVYSVAFSPDGRTVASGSHDGTLRLWDAATGKEWCVLENDHEPIYFVAFSRDGRTLGSITLDGKIDLWETISQKHIRMIPGTKALLRASFDFSPDGNRIAAPGGMFTVMFWDRKVRRQAEPLARSARELESLWLNLASSDAGKADEALWSLVDAPGQAVKALGDWLKPMTLDPKKIVKLIGELDSDEFATRERAAEQLAQLGSLAERALQRALEGKPSPEVQQRVEGLLQKLERAAVSPEVCRQVRAVHVLEHIGTKDSREVLGKLAGGAEGDRLTQEAKSALSRLGGSIP